MEIRELGGQLESAEVHPQNRAGGVLLAQGRDAYRRMIEQYRKGMRGYQKDLELARGKLGMLESSNRGVVEKLRREAQATAERKRMVETVIRVSVGIVLLLLAGLAVLGNRGRRKAMARAVKALALRREEMLATVDRLFALMDRAGVVVGPEDELAKRGYEGETLAESLRAIRSVDRAFVLSSNVRRIIDRAGGLIEPSNPFSRLRNLVSRGRYERAADMLDATVSLDAEPPPLPGAEKHGVGQRLGSADEGGGEVELSGWRERLEAAMDEADEALDRVENAWLTIVPRREALADAIEALTGRRAEIDDATVGDGWFRMEPVFDELAAGDGGRAGAGDGARPPRSGGGARRADRRRRADGRGGRGAGGPGVSGSGSEEWGKLKQADASLDGQGRATLWIDRALDGLSRRADELAVDGVAQPVGEGVARLGEDMAAFAARVGDAAALSERSESSLLPAISAAEELVRTARRELGAALGVAAEQVLCEGPDLDPSRFLAKAHEQRQAAGAALDRGENVGGAGVSRRGGPNCGPRRRNSWRPAGGIRNPRSRAQGAGGRAAEADHAGQGRRGGGRGTAEGVRAGSAGGGAAGRRVGVSWRTAPGRLAEWIRDAGGTAGGGGGGAGRGEIVGSACVARRRGGGGGRWRGACARRWTRGVTNCGNWWRGTPAGWAMRRDATRTSRRRRPTVG